MNTLVNAESLAEFLVQHQLGEYSDAIIDACLNSSTSQHGRLSQWFSKLDELPDIDVGSIDLIKGVKLTANQLDPSQQAQFKQQLLSFKPWRKGPVELLGVLIDTEWRSDLKWNRIAGQLNLKDKRILDVGCGNGYYMFRMLGAGAKSVIGVDPVALYVVQFLLINKYLKSSQLQLLPIGLESLPVMAAFDVVFSMGVLYHRRQPLDHLMDLKGQLTKGGRLVLETLVLDSDSNEVLVPDDRYAGMKNVFSIPSVPKLIGWLQQIGFTNIDVLDLSVTTVNEQRQTQWMTTYSLNQFLDPTNHRLTIEGYPSPVRVMLSCTV